VQPELATTSFLPCVSHADNGEMLGSSLSPPRASLRVAMRRAWWPLWCVATPLSSPYNGRVSKVLQTCRCVYWRAALMYASVEMFARVDSFSRETD
jgi:hypothetical protein